MEQSAFQSEDGAVFPNRIVLSEDRTELTLVWADGRLQRLSADLLRSFSRSSGSVRDRVEGLEADPTRNIAITAVNLVGTYAVNLCFSDGHDRGIYPWSYLVELSEQNA